MSLEDYKKNPSKYKFRLACRVYSFHEGLWGMILDMKKRRRVLSFEVCAKPNLLEFLSQGLGREKNKRE